MPNTILPPFLSFPREGAIIGHLLAGYTTLELDLMNCVQTVRDDLDTCLKVLFRARGETQRIQIGDALGRHYYHGHKLGTEFEMAIGALRHCLKIRNQYAHCVWYDDLSGKLAFVNLEELAEENDLLTDLISLTRLHVDIQLLVDQEAYFVYAGEMLTWVNLAAQNKAGKMAVQPPEKPKQISPPPLHLP